MNKRLNQGEAVASLQVTHIGNIPLGDFKTGLHFLIKNITEEIVTLNVKLLGEKDFITTTFYPGWNVEIVEEIKEAPSNTLQYGY